MPPIKPSGSRFFKSDSSDSSDSEEEAPSPKASKGTVNLSKLFAEFLEDPLYKPGTKTSSIGEAFKKYLKATCDYDLPSFFPFLEELIRDPSFDTIGPLNKRLLSEYINAIKLMPDSPKSTLKSKQSQVALDILSSKLSSAPKSSPHFHKDAFHNLLFLKPFLQELREIECSTRPFFQPIINMVHITQGEKTSSSSVGYHFDKQEDVAVTLMARNPVTGVFCGTYQLEEGLAPKFSTFFPDSISSEEELVAVIQGAEKVAQNGNRFLYQTKTTPPFFIEKLFQEGGLVVHSAYPIFYFDKYEPGQKYVITESCTLDAEEVLNTTGTHGAHVTVQYVIDGAAIVDVAPLFQHKTGVSQGIYFTIPTTT